MVAELAPEAVTKLKSWRKEVEEPWSPVDIKCLQALSGGVDTLYSEYFAGPMAGTGGLRAGGGGLGTGAWRESVSA